MSVATPLDQPRAIGRARVSSKVRAGTSHIDGLRQSGALKLLFPGRKSHVEAIMINTAGGITGGDRFDVEAHAGEGSALTVSTQAAERVYRAQDGQTGHLSTHLSADQDAQLHWLPQETILYNGAALRRRLRVDLASGATFLMVEPLLFGRHAMGEELRQLRFDDRIDIHVDGKPVYLDGTSLHGDVATQLDRPAIANGARAMASLVWYAPQAAGQLAFVRAKIGALGGASLLAENLLCARLLAEDGFALRKALLPILDHLSNNQLPACWRL